MRAVLKFLDDLNNNLQPFLEPALLPVVARSITASIPPLIVPSLGVRSLFFNTCITSVDMKTRIDLNPFIVHPWHSLDSGWTWCFFNSGWVMIYYGNVDTLQWRLMFGQDFVAKVWSKFKSPTVVKMRSGFLVKTLRLRFCQDSRQIFFIKIGVKNL